MTSKKKQNSVIISVCSNDVRFCLSVYKEGDIILTPYMPIEMIYNKLGIPVILSKNLFLWVLFSKIKMVYIFGQGPTFFILYFQRFLRLFGKKLYFSDSYLSLNVAQLAPEPNIGHESVKLYFPRWIARLLKFEPCYDGGFFWLQSYSIIEPMVQIKTTYNIQAANCLIILDEVFMIDQNILDIQRLAARYKLYLKRKSRGGVVKIDQKILTFFEEHVDTIIPIELYSNYIAIIGNHSIALNMPNSISLFEITRFGCEVPLAYTPESLYELYNHLNC
jgi:hypothetical protein